MNFVNAFPVVAMSVAFQRMREYLEVIYRLERIAFHVCIDIECDLLTIHFKFE